MPRVHHSQLQHQHGSRVSTPTPPTATTPEDPERRGQLPEGGPRTLMLLAQPLSSNQQRRNRRQSQQTAVPFFRRFLEPAKKLQKNCSGFNQNHHISPLGPPGQQKLQKNCK